jgi:DnaJ-domain-containing protein 1
MIDYFALLDQPRAAWLDAEQLKEAFHACTRQAHPDAQGDEAEFAQVNEGYQVLRDPKRRLRHLFALRGDSLPTNSAQIPAEIADLFPTIAGLTRQAATVLQKSREATSALSRSLVRPELLETQRAMDAMIARVDELLVSANEQLRADSADLHDLYQRLSYLTHWIAELKEKQLQISTVFI